MAGGIVSVDQGCAYLVVEEGDGSGAVSRHRRCGAPRRLGSSYCPDHHALCHLASGSAAEAGQLREVERLARAVGGRGGRGGRAGRPSRRFLARLERAARGLS